MSKKTNRTGKSVRSKDKERIRNLPAFVEAYLHSATGQRLLSSPVPRLATAFAKAVNVKHSTVNEMLGARPA